MSVDVIDVLVDSNKLKCREVVRVCKGNRGDACQARVRKCMANWDLDPSVGTLLFTLRSQSGDQLGHVNVYYSEWPKVAGADVFNTPLNGETLGVIGWKLYDLETQNNRRGKTQLEGGRPQPTSLVVPFDILTGVARSMRIHRDTESLNPPVLYDGAIYDSDGIFTFQIDKTGVKSVEGEMYEVEFLFYDRYRMRKISGQPAPQSSLSIKKKVYQGDLDRAYA